MFIQKKKIFIQQTKDSDDNLIIQRKVPVKIKWKKTSNLNNLFFSISISNLQRDEGKLKHLYNVMSKRNLHFQISLMTS